MAPWVLPGCVRGRPTQTGRAFNQVQVIKKLLGILTLTGRVDGPVSTVLTVTALSHLSKERLHRLGAAEAGSD